MVFHFDNDNKSQMISIIVLLTFVIRLNSYSQHSEYKFVKIGVEDGLPSENCNFCFFDSEDYLWIGTNTGVVRYDGYEAENLMAITGNYSASRIFNDVAEDTSGNLWFATSDGIYGYLKEKGELVRIDVQKKLNKFNVSNYVTTIMCDNNNVLWFGGETGLFRYYIDKGSLIHNRSLVASIKDFTLVTDILMEQGQIWVASWNRGLIRYDYQTDEFVDFPIFNDFNDPKKNNQLYALYKAETGYFYAGTWGGGVYVLDVSGSDTPVIVKKFTRNNCGISHDIVYSITEDSGQNIWIGTPNGLNIIANPLSEDVSVETIINKEENPFSLSNNEVRSIIRDKVGTMWLATAWGGVNKVNMIKKTFETQVPSNFSVKNNILTIHSFTEDFDGRILLGVQGDVFTLFDEQSNAFVSYEDVPDYAVLKRLELNTVKCFFWDEHSNLWIGTRYRGIIRYNPKTKKYVRLNARSRKRGHPSVREVFSFFEDKRGRIWAATDSGIFRITLGESGKIRDFKQELITSNKEEDKQQISKNISDVVVDQNDILWVSSFDKGLFCSRNPVKDEVEIDFKHYGAEKEEYGIKSNHIICLFNDSRGKMWIGTGGDGLKYWSLETESFHSPVSANLLNNIIFFGINEDARGRIWATTNHGVLCFNSNREGEYQAEFYTEKNGLQSNVFAKGAFYETGKGKFIVGGSKGFNIFNPESVEADKYVPQLKITGVINTEENLNTYKLGKAINTFKHTQNHIQVAFAALDYRYPEKNRYAYKLSGVDKDWVYTSVKNKLVSYSNLHPGKYTFMVKGTNYMGVWNNEPREVSFKIKQAPFKTWWAITIYSVIFVSLVVFIIRLRFNNLKTKNKLEIEKLERIKSEKLNQFKLQFFTNLSHELLTPLSILKIVTDQWDKYTNDKDIDVKNIFERNVGQLRSHINKVLQFRKVETGNMKLTVKECDIPELISDIIANYKLIAEHREVDFKAKVPAHLWGCIDLEKLDIILNNLLSNAFKYNGVGGGVKLLVDVTEKEQVTYLEFSVTDSGYGIPKERLEHIFDRFYRINEIDPKIEGLGIGLALVKNLVTLHRGDVSVKSKLGKGTTFKVSLPISKEFYSNLENTETKRIIDADKVVSYKKKSQSSELNIEVRPDKTILIIDDDIDFLTLLKSSVSDYYSVLSASSGTEGLRVAQEQEVDLVLSDFMMPEMNGAELCEQLKNEVNTSHIPFVLITASHEESTRFLGYESGVDSVLTKPLTIKVLLARINKLLKKKEETFKVLKKGDVFEPTEFRITTLDEQFLEKAKNMVEKHMEDQEFSVKVLQQEMGLSHSMLYRKIKGILGITPNEYIRNIRLSRAAQMLEADEKLNISDVAFKVGFNDLSYFGVCFKKQFGLTPRDFQKKGRGE